MKLFFVAISTVAAVSTLRSGPGGRCERSCLEGVLSEYLSALVAHDPWRLPVAEDVIYVENGQFLPLGTGEWRLAGSPGKYRHVFADPESKQVAAITTIEENGVPLIYTVRLKLEADNRDDSDITITEIETQITRDSEGAARYEKLGQPEDVWLEAVPPTDRISRAKLIEQTNKYYTGMERNDPKGNYSFFDRDCNRLEDGLQTTNVESGAPYGHSNDTSFASLGCEAQFQTGFLGFVTKIRNRRYPVVDEERQAVLAITIFDHNGTVRELPSVNGTSSPIPAYFDVPRTLIATEGFRLRGDKLFRIEMTLTETPYGMRAAFPARLAESRQRRETIASNFLRRAPYGNNAYLDKTLDRVLEAMQNHNASRLPLAKDVRYSENGQFLALNDGLWETLANYSRPGVDSYAARFADPADGTVGYWGLIKEHTTPGVLALRITVDEGEISEIEAIAVRAESPGSRGGTLTLMRPPLPIEWPGDSLGSLDTAFQRVESTNKTVNQSLSETVIENYFDGWEEHSNEKVRFALGCSRRDNGVQENRTCAGQLGGFGATPNGLYKHTTTIRDRRILVADTSRGVALAVALVDNPATASSPSPLPVTERIPGTYMVPQLIKVVNGTIARVESMIKWMPYGYTSAWAEDDGEESIEDGEGDSDCD